MAIETDDIIRSARDRTGNKADVAVGEQFVPDEAILAGIEDAIVECNEAFGASTSLKEVTFQATTQTSLPSPPVPVLTPVTGTGSLPAGSYNYQITATRDSGETLAGGQAASNAVLTATGQIVLTWSAVAGADGYNIYGRTPGQPGKMVNIPAGTLTWTDTGVAIPGSMVPTADTTGSNNYYLQDYDIPTYVGTDVEEIVEVLRSDAYFSESMLQPMMVDPRTGIPMARAAWIDMGYQNDVLEDMQAQARWRKVDAESWEVININGSPTLRIMPPPTQPVLISVRYLSTSDAVESLPDEARPALEYAACVAILDSVLNRVNSTPAGMDAENARGWRAWIEMVERQRDRYESKFRKALGKKSKG